MRFCGRLSVFQNGLPEYFIISFLLLLFISLPKIPITNMHDAKFGLQLSRLWDQTHLLLLRLGTDTEGKGGWNMDVLNEYCFIHKNILDSLLQLK